MELNKKELAVGRAKGHFINEEMINTANFDEKFCAITLWDVFEHIKDGLQFLNDSKRLLNEGGLVFMQIPSSDSLAAKIMKSACNMFDGARARKPLWIRKFYNTGEKSRI